MGWHFRAGERLALVSIPSKRDFKDGDSQVLERISIHLLGKIVKNGMAILVLKRGWNDQVLEKIGID